MIRAQQEEQQHHVDDQQNAQHAEGAAVGDDELHDEAHAARDGFLVGFHAGGILAHGLFEAVRQLGRHGFAARTAADEEELQQNAVALLAFLAVRGGGGDLRQLGLPVGEGEQQRMAETVALRVAQRGKLLFELGGHLRAVHGERHIKELQGGAGLLVLRQGCDEGVKIGLRGGLVARQLRPVAKEHGVEPVAGARAFLRVKAGKRGGDGCVVVGIQSALHVIQMGEAVLRVVPGGGEGVHAQHAGCDHQHAHDQRDDQRGLDDRGLPAVAKLRLRPRFVLHPASTPLHGGNQESAVRLQRTAPVVFGCRACENRGRSRRPAAAP